MPIETTPVNASSPSTSICVMSGYVRRKYCPDFCGVSMTTFNRWERRVGFPPRYSMGYRSIYYRRDDLVAWMECEMGIQASVEV